MKIIKTYRKATVHDYARAAAKSSRVINGGWDNAISIEGAAKGAGTGATLGTIIPGVGNVAGGIIGAIGGLFSGKASKITREEYLKKRDIFFKTVADLGKPVTSIPGTPFAQFGRHRGKAFKSYDAMLAALYQTAEIYYPELTGLTPATGENPPIEEVVAPLTKVMENAIRDTGSMPDKETMGGLLKQFNETVVDPATGKDSTSTSTGKEALGNAAIEFISTLCEKKRNGETLPPIYDKIAEGCMRVQEKIENKVKSGIQGDIGAFVTDNVLLIGIAAMLLLFAIMSKK